MTRAALVSTLNRIFCGAVFLIHGTPKIFNLQETSSGFVAMGFPGWLAVPVAVLEFFGGILLMAGLLTRIMTGLFMIEMVVAGLKVHFPVGWDVFQFGDPMARGYEYNLALILLLLGVLLIGPGPFSVDRLIGWRRGREEPPVESFEPRPDVAP
ncbi:MAG TPA: DoxX family protein [Gemmatimonadota bacterium]|nr:DoxX family protein [Gemmatimonadota bacterium]